MKSIDRLREYVCSAPMSSMTNVARSIVVGMTDEIEREVEDARDRDYRNGREDAAGAAEFADRLCRASERREDVTLWGVDYTALPVDAGGVPIHVGDVMEERSGHTFEAASLMAFGGSDNWLVLSDPQNFSSFREPHDIRHHHAPTVEDVLREFAQEMNENLGMYTGEAIDADEWHEADERTIAATAAKLRLAGEDA